MISRDVNTAPPNAKPSKPISKFGQKQLGSSDYVSEDYENYFDEDRQRQTDKMEDLFRVPNSAGGNGFEATDSFNDRWLDGRTLHKGECVPYLGRACRNYLTGKFIVITSENRDDIYDIDHHISAAMLFINKMPNVSTECKNYSHAVACYHRYKICSQNPGQSPTNNVISLCRSDCDDLTANTCPKEMAMAAQHELVGDGPKSLLPQCETLSPSAQQCIRVLKPVSPQYPGNLGNEQPKPQFSHWCYVDTGLKYEGNVAVTKSKKICLPWRSATSSEFSPDNNPRLRNVGNHCRNPGGPIGQPWCYTAPNGLPEPCEIHRCPDGVYPDYSDNAPDLLYGGGARNGNFLDSIGQTWQDMTPQTQLGAAAGLGALLMLICCVCCCRRKRKQKSGNSAGTTTTGGHSTVTSSVVNKNGGYFMQSVNGGGSSIANSAINSAYYRKANGMNGNFGMMTQPGYEMNSLLNLRQGPGSAVHSIGSHAYATAQQQSVLVPPYSPHTSTDPSEMCQQINSIPESQLTINSVLGEDKNLVIYVADCNGYCIGGKTLKVAVETLRVGANQIESASFHDEIRMLASFTHLNVIRLLGVTYLENSRLGACFDYAIHGDLISWLKIREPGNNDIDEERMRNYEDMMRISYQIAGGLEYLSSNGYVHKDLAARNVLIADQLVVKIADFAKFMKKYDHCYYQTNPLTRLPIRWMPRETLDNIYNQLTDVYSFGVTLWEIYSFGQIPYRELSNQQVLENISIRDVLQCPSACPSNIYGMIVECCNEHADRRPSFAELHKKLQIWSALGYSTMARASSIHSGNSSNARGSRQSSSDRQSNNIIRGSMGGMLDQYGGVPSPAPQNGQTTKLVLANANSIIHSTPISEKNNFPIGLRSPRSRRENGEDTNPLMRRNVRDFGAYSSDSE
ncbi:BMA-CAM-1, isoform c [Aphelenchoides bicaudatus]|nr:BMA-CAM-1, isoform c [Aphelenchoides bicaudatus]